MEILSYVLSLIGLASMIAASLVKGRSMKVILILVFCGNISVALSYLLGGSGINGAASCFIGGAQSIINYFFDSKNKPLPKWLVAVYALAFIGVNIWVAGVNFLCILAILASLTFIMCIGQKSGAKYRFWTIVNVVMWGIYDIVSKSYGALFTHVPLLLFTIAGMIIHDRKKKAE
jgi:hypothetical protein